jgi:hypothetical protein
MNAGGVKFFIPVKTLTTGSIITQVKPDTVRGPFYAGSFDRRIILRCAGGFVTCSSDKAYNAQQDMVKFHTV